MTKRDWIIGLFIGLLVGWAVVRPWLLAHGLAG